MLSPRLNSLPNDWLELFKPYLDSEKGQDIIKKIDDYLEVQRGNFHPVADKILAPFHSVPVERVKVVIVGHFPYPNPAHVTGLPFSNPINIPMAKSVKNIYRAILRDIGGIMPAHGSLEHLPPQGVLLINRKFTTGPVYNDFPKGHSNIGWEHFSAAVVHLLSKRLPETVFLLWGKPAGELANMQRRLNTGLCEPIIDERHLILTSTHPSYDPPFENPFLMCRHFSLTNDFLRENGRLPEIDWLPNI